VDVVVTMKEFKDGTIAYRTGETRDAVSVGHDAVGVTPEPVTAVGGGAVNETT
jgi:hypothetical protein